jgi:deoxyribose-phosphate aldolase
VTEPEPSNIASHIQNTLIAPNVTRTEVLGHLQACGEHGFHAAMIPMCWVPLAREVLTGSGVRVATFICIGLGHESVHAKVALTRECWALGADEIDYEPNMSFLASGMHAEFAREAELLVEAAEGRPLKAMLELGYLAERQQRALAVRILCDAGVPWIKNSSGVGPGSEPASVENIRFLKRVVGEDARVKGSGGIRSYRQVVELLGAGAELVGTSAGTAIVSGAGSSNTGY